MRALTAILVLVVAGCGGARAGGRCALELRSADGRIRADFAGDGDRLVVVHEGHVAWRGGARHTFWLDDYRGADRVTVRATGSDGRVCSASATLPGGN